MGPGRGWAQRAQQGTWSFPSGSASSSLLFTRPLLLNEAPSFLKEAPSLDVVEATCKAGAEGRRGGGVSQTGGRGRERRRLGAA